MQNITVGYSSAIHTVQQSCLHKKNIANNTDNSEHVQTIENSSVNNSCTAIIVDQSLAPAVEAGYYGD